MYIRKTAGFSLIEFLCVLAMSGFVISAGYQLLHQIHHLNQWQQAIAELQAMQRIFLQRFILLAAKAGDRSCERPAAPLDVENAIMGFHHLIPKEWRNQIQPGTDLLILGGCYPLYGRLSFHKIAFFIADTHRVDVRGSPIGGLFQKRLDGQREEWLEGVTHWDIRYTIQKPPSTHLQELTAESVADWRAVATIVFFVNFTAPQWVGAMPIGLRLPANSQLHEGYLTQSFIFVTPLKFIVKNHLTG